jgi:hypothetical protein
VLNERVVPALPPEPWMTLKLFTSLPPATSARFLTLLEAGGGDIDKPVKDSAAWEATVEPLRGSARISPKSRCAPTTVRAAFSPRR